MPKIDIYMPMYISRFMAATSALDDAQTGQYTMALLWHWKYGPLPADLAGVARIMRISGPDAPSIALAMLNTFFERLEDGRWVQPNNLRIREEFMARAIAARDKASHAAKIRWDRSAEERARIKAERAKNIHASSIAPAVPEQCHTDVVQVLEVQEQAPSANNAEGEATPQAAPRPHAPSIANGSGQPPSKKPPRATGKRSWDMETEKAAARPPAGVERGSTLIRNGASNGTNGHRVTDPRFVVFRAEVLDFWRANHGGELTHHWSAADGRALNLFLANAPSIDLAHFQRLLKHRAASEVNLSELPVRWLPSLMRFASGPLNSFGDPLRAKRAR